MVTGTNSNSQNDRDRLQHMITTFCGVTQDQTQRATHPIVLALSDNGINAFKKDFVPLTGEEILGLHYVDTADNGTLKKLGIAHGRMLHSTLAFYHVACRNRKSDVDMMSLDVNMFHAWRTTHYNPSEPILPWGYALQKQTEKNNLEWMKINRPQRSDLPEFRDQTYWPKNKER